MSIKLTNILNERSGLVAKANVGPYKVQVVKNMKINFLRISKGGAVRTAQLAKCWDDGRVKDVLQDIEASEVKTIWNGLFDVDHPKYNELDCNGKISIKKSSLKQQSLGRESVEEGSGDKKMYSWGEMNNALMKTGISPRIIAKILSNLADGRR